MSTNARLDGVASQHFLRGKLRERRMSTYWIPKLLGNITYPGKQEQRESMSCCRLLDNGQHTLPEREAKASAMMMMMLGWGRPTYSHNRHRDCDSIYLPTQHNGRGVYVKELPVPRIKTVVRRKRGWNCAAWFGRHRGSVCGVVDKVGRVCGDGCGGEWSSA